MEPTRESIAAPRRELTDAEKESISEAVTLKMKDSNHREFKWVPLVVRSRDNVTDFCGLVRGNDIDDEYVGFSKYYAQLTFDRHGTLSKVNVLAIAKIKSDDVPTVVDSICIQDGYNLLP